MQYPFTRKMKANVICDILDGCKYQDLQKPGKFLSYPEHTGLILNTDGVAVFKSSKHSIWPIYLSITSLPPHLRMKKDFILLAGLWYGPTKPSMNVILEPVLEEINKLKMLGIDVQTSSGTKTVRAMLLLSVFDLPAKSAAVNMKQFNGKYGCLYCEHPGEALKQGCTIYKPNVPCVLRTHELVCQHAEEAVRIGSAVYGIKGYSVLSTCINLVNDIPVDYMHAVLEGVTKYITGMWFNSENHKSSFYLGNRVKEIDSLLLQIKPPSSFRRSPRPISTTLKFWKANEYRAWLLFYSLPILIRFLPSEYVHHWSLLVYSIHVLLSSEIQDDTLPVVDAALGTFYALIPELYGFQACTANMHSLVHLTRFVKMWGPLWGYSLFGFENMNGHIRKTFHGTKQIVDQLVFSVKAEQSLYFQIQNHTVENHTAAAFLSSYTRHYNSLPSFEGKCKKVVVPELILDALQKYSGETLNRQRNIASRLRMNSAVFQSNYFTKQTQVTDSSVCSFLTPQNKIGLGRILVFDTMLKVAVIHPYLVSHEHILGSLRKARIPQLYTASQNISLSNFFAVVTQLPLSRVIVIPILKILQTWVCIRLLSREILVLIPNNYEQH